MKVMQPASARALTGMAALILLIGLMVMSPSAAFLAFCLAAIMSAIPAIFGTGKTRLIAAVLLLGSIGLAARIYPEFRSEQEKYRHRKPTALQQTDGDLTRKV